jgi:hypothetical protein
VISAPPTGSQCANTESGQIQVQNSYGAVIALATIPAGVVSDVSSVGASHWGITYHCAATYTVTFPTFPSSATYTFSASDGVPDTLPASFATATMSLAQVKAHGAPGLVLGNEFI